MSDGVFQAQVEEKIQVGMSAKSNHRSALRSDVAVLIAGHVMDFAGVEVFPAGDDLVVSAVEVAAIGVKKKLSIGITNAGICNVEIHIPEFIINIRRATIKIYNRTGKAGIRLAVFTE